MMHNPKPSVTSTGSSTSKPKGPGLAHQPPKVVAKTQSWTLPLCLGSGLLAALLMQARHDLFQRKAATSPPTTPERVAPPPPSRVVAPKTPGNGNQVEIKLSSDSLLEALARLGAPKPSASRQPVEGEDEIIAKFRATGTVISNAELQTCWADRLPQQKFLSIMAEHYRLGLRDSDPAISSETAELERVAKYRNAFPKPAGDPDAAAITLAIKAYTRGLKDGQAVPRILPEVAQTKPAKIATTDTRPTPNVVQYPNILTEFGSRSKPGFVVSKQLPKLKTFAEQAAQFKSVDIDPAAEKEIRELLADLDGSIKRAEDSLKQRDLKSSTVVSPALSLESEYRLVMREVQHKLLEVAKTLKPAEDRAALLFDIPSSRIREDTAHYLQSPYLAKYGSPDLFLRRLVKEVTGQELGPDVTFSITSSIGEPYQVDAEKRRVLVIEGKGLAKYEGVLGRLAAGTGVLIKQSTERADGRPEAISSGSAPTPMQHAAAIALQNVVASHLIANYPEFSFDTQMLMLEDSSFLETSGDHSFDRAREIYNAVVTVLGSQGDAFNYLISRQTLTPAMEEALKADSNSASRRFDRLRQSVKGVSDTVDQLLKKLSSAND